MIIRPDDLSPGMLVVISAGEIQEVVTPFGIEEVENRRFNGAVLRIAAVSLPFVAVDILGPQPARTAVDTRLWEFSRVNPDYVRAMHPELPSAAFAKQQIPMPEEHTT